MMIHEVVIITSFFFERFEQKMIFHDCIYIYLIVYTKLQGGIHHGYNKENERLLFINIRVTRERKKQIKENAEQLGMSISSYIDYLESHQQVVELSYGKELMQEVYDLNNQLNKLDKYPLLPIQELRDTISQSIKKINEQMKAGI